MSKELETWKNLLEGYDESEDVIYFVDKDKLSTIEQALKDKEKEDIVFFIFKTKHVILHHLVNCDSLEHYNSYLAHQSNYLTEKEYNLIREVLNKDYIEKSEEMLEVYRETTKLPKSILDLKQYNKY